MRDKRHPGTESPDPRDTAAWSAGSPAATLLDLYDRLLRYYGPQGWWPAESRFEVMVGAILTQAVAWSNVEKAVANLKAAQSLDFASLHRLPVEELAPLLRPAGYYNAKARKLKALVTHLHDHYQFDLDVLFSQSLRVLRDELLSIHGIGPETADSIVLYAAGQPVFVVDGYTRRLCSRLGLASDTSGYDDLQALFEDNLPRETELFQEYHALIVQHAKTTCRKQPLCSDCLLLAVCAFGQR
jgi:endonuclease-3 related protein